MIKTWYTRNGFKLEAVASIMVLVLALAFIAVPRLTIPAFAQIPVTTTNRYIYVPPQNCSMVKISGALSFTAGPAVVRAAANNFVLAGTVDNMAGVLGVSCDFSVAARPGVTSGTTGSFTVRDVSLLYGVQTTAISSIAAATLSTVSYPASTAAGVAAAGTVAAAGGTLSVTPSSLQLTTTTTGQCFNERLQTTTPVNLADRQRLTVEQQFTLSAAVATLQICGAIIHATQN